MPTQVAPANTNDTSRYQGPIDVAEPEVPTFSVSRSAMKLPGLAKTPLAPVTTFGQLRPPLLDP